MEPTPAASTALGCAAPWRMDAEGISPGDGGHLQTLQALRPGLRAGSSWSRHASTSFVLSIRCRHRDIGDVAFVDGETSRVGIRVPHHPFGAIRRSPQLDLVVGELTRADVRPLRPGRLDGLLHR